MRVPRTGTPPDVSIPRRLLAALGFALWGGAAYVLIVVGDHLLNGGLVVLGALCLVIVASGAG